jgi:transposase-like protein
MFALDNEPQILPASGIQAWLLYLFGSENRTDWLKILNDPIERGLKRIVVIVSDDFPGLSDAFKALYPLCNKELENIKSLREHEEGKERFEKLCHHFLRRITTSASSNILKR